MDSDRAVQNISAEQAECVWETDRTEQPERTAAIGQAEYTVSTTLKDQLFHGLLTINLLTVLILVGTFAEIADTVHDVLSEGIFSEGTGAMLLQGGVVFLVFLGAFKSMLGGFVRYYGFRIERIGKELHIQYGLFTKTEYTIIIPASVREERPDPGAAGWDSAGIFRGFPSGDRRTAAFLMVCRAFFNGCDGSVHGCCRCRRL